MSKAKEPIAYKGMTVRQLGEEYNPDLTIPNVRAWLQKNREVGESIKTKLKPMSDIAYGNEAVQKLDIYAPDNAHNLPVLIDIHGGGWMFGSKNPRSIPAEALMSHGVIWIPIDYGLAPECRIQDIIAHVRKAITWIFNHIHQYGGDQNCIFISGASAGAHLAAASLMPGWNEKYGVPVDVLKGMLLLSGVYDLEYLVHSDLPWAHALKLSQDEVIASSPIHHLPKQPIPAVIAYGENETNQFHCQAKDYARALTDGGCHVNLIKIPHANHYETMNVLADIDSETFRATINMIKPVE